MREHGEDRHTRHPVMTPEMIRQLPAGHALIVRGGYAPVIAKLPHVPGKTPPTGTPAAPAQDIAHLIPVQERSPVLVPPAVLPRRPGRAGHPGRGQQRQRRPVPVG